MVLNTETIKSIESGAGGKDSRSRYYAYPFLFRTVFSLFISLVVWDRRNKSIYKMII